VEINSCPKRYFKEPDKDELEISCQFCFFCLETVNVHLFLGEEKKNSR